MTTHADQSPHDEANRPPAACLVPEDCESPKAILDLQTFIASIMPHATFTLFHRFEVTYRAALGWKAFDMTEAEFIMWTRPKLLRYRKAEQESYWPELEPLWEELYKRKQESGGPF